MRSGGKQNIIKAQCLHHHGRRCSSSSSSSAGSVWTPTTTATGQVMNAGQFGLTIEVQLLAPAAASVGFVAAARPTCGLTWRTAIRLPSAPLPAATSSSQPADTIEFGSANEETTQLESIFHRISWKPRPATSAGRLR